MSTLYPTHTCFDDALEHLAERLRQEPETVDSGRLHLVHGIAHVPEGPDRGTPFAHAWLEEQAEGGVVVWQFGILDGERIAYAVDRDDWYREMSVTDATRYTPREAAAENRRTVHFGPWLERYQALCAKPGQRRSFG